MSYKMLVMVLLALGLLLRILGLIFFPHFITEDSDAYILSSEYMRTGNPEFKDCFSYRQLGYPSLILFLRWLTPYPFYTLLLLQVCLSLASCVLIYGTCRELNTSRPFSLLACSFFLFNGQSIIYALVVAPETCVVFFLTLSVYIYVRHARLILGGERTGSFWLFVLQALSLFCVSAIKELFLAFAILVFGLYAALLLYVVVKRRPVMAQGGFLLASLVLFGAIFGASLAYSRSLLQTDRFRPFTFPWALALSSYYTDYDSPTHAEFKHEARALVAERKSNLGTWTYALKGGYKVNSAFEETYYDLIRHYVRRKYSPADDYEESCLIERVSTEIALEALPKQLGHYLRWWLAIEVAKGFFPVDEDYEEKSFNGAFREMTLRALRQRPELLPETRGSVLYTFLTGESRLKTLVSILFRRILLRYYSYWPFSLLFILYCALVPFVRRIRPADAPEAFGLALVIFHVLAYVLLIGSMVWFHERYTLYVSFGLVIVGVKFLDKVVQWALWDHKDKIIASLDRLNPLRGEPRPAS